jgi:carboxyl-terminal processing protease
MSGLSRLALSVALVAGCRADASSPTPHSEEAAAEVAEAKPDVGDVHPRLADLESRTFPLLVWAAHQVDQEYFDKQRFDPREQLLSATTFIGLQTPEFFAEASGDELVVTVRARTERFSTAELTTLDQAVDRLEEVLVFTQSVLDLEEEPLHELEYTAINGLFAPLDPHTILLTPEEHSDLGVRTRGRFGGIGAQIHAEDRRIVVVRVLPGMPADKAGVEAGDVILKIDRVATVNMSGDEAQELLRGPVGSTVAVKVRRDKKTLTFDLVRDTIKIDSVEPQLLPGGVAYVRITNFQENTAEQMREALQDMVGARGAEAVVLDLRGNAGGLLSQATAVVDELVDEGELVIVRSAMGREVDSATKGRVVPASAGLVVMVDEESASAAEIVSGGLKALGRGLVVGRSSFGKGTVQMIKPAAPYGRELALKLTVAEYLVAGDEKIQSIGVRPDLEVFPVELSGIQGIARYFDVERFERQRERSRTAHLPSAKHMPEIPTDDPPLGIIHYLWTNAVPKGLAEGADAQLLTVLADPEIRLARRLALSLAGVGDDDEPKTRAAVETIRAEEEVGVVAALETSGIDWHVDAGAASDVVVRAKLRREAPVEAGAPFELDVEIENRGTTALSRVHAITDCVHDELDGIELLVGAIAPGATAKHTMTVHVMPWHTDFTDVIDVAVHVGEPDDEPDAAAQVMFEVQGAARPRLSYDWWIVDDPALVADAPARTPAPPLPGEPAFEVSGNGDGMLQPGERVLLAFVAHNDGEGPSPDVRAVLRNLSGQQGLLEEGAVKVGELLPGQSRRGAFGITINADADPALPFELELALGDARMRTRAQKKVRLRVLQAAPELERAAQQIEVGADGLRLYAGAHASADIATDLAEGARLDTVGTIGQWRVVEAGLRGRRLFVPTDLGLEIEGTAGAAHALATAELFDAVVPPAVTIDAVPRVTSAAAFELRGAATHPQRARDVVVLVRPPGPSQIDRKVHYTANPETTGPAARRFEFASDVPLAPGGNRVIILVRAGDKVEQREDLWIYREPESTP